MSLCISVVLVVTSLSFLIFFSFFLAIPCSLWNLPLSGIGPRPLHWKPGILATRPPGKSHLDSFLMQHSCHPGFPRGSDGKESACNVGDLGLIPGLGRSPGGEHGNPLQYSYLENSMDRGSWQAPPVHRVAKSQTWLKRLVCWWAKYHLMLPRGTCSWIR